MTLTVGSLFSGIGGLDLGLERAGMTVRWQSEIDPYCCRVLAKHWPNVPNLGDVTTIDWSGVEHVDLICGGYPCQPFSLAGGRRGADDPRHLWPLFRDGLRAIRPRYALLENVPGHLTLGLPEVLADLADLGFDAEWSLVPACAMGASHTRDRVFVLAYPPGEPRNELPLHRIRAESERGTSREPGRRDPRASGRDRRWSLHESPICGGDDGVPHRVDRLRALGNAVVPQVAEWIGHRIMEAA